MRINSFILHTMCLPLGQKRFDGSDCQSDHEDFESEGELNR